MLDFKVTDFLTVDQINQVKAFVPRNREEYLAITQAAYNLKSHTRVPTTVHIEPTNECNQTCRMCLHPDMKREVREIDEVMAYKAIDECREIGDYAVHNSLFGEPFLNRKTIEYMAYAKQAGIPLVSVTTNLSSIKRREIDRLVEAGIDSIHVSFEGIDRERYREIRGIDSYEKVKSNLGYLLSKRAQSGADKPWVALTYVRTTESDEEIEQFKVEWQPQVNDLHISPQFEYLGRSQLIREGDIGANSNQILARNSDKRVPCRQLWHRLVVLSNGDLVPCSQNIDGELAVGNIQDMTIVEAWNGPRMNQLRAAHLSNDYQAFPVCQRCIDWDWSGKVDVRPKTSE